MAEAPPRCPLCTSVVEEQRCLGCDALLHEVGGKLVPLSQEIRRGALVCARDLRQVAPPGRIDRKPFVAGSAQGSYPPTGLAIELGPGLRYALSEEQLSLRDLVLCTQAWCPDPDGAVGVFARHSSIDRADAHLGFELWPHRRQARIIWTTARCSPPTPSAKSTTSRRPTRPIPSPGRTLSGGRWAAASLWGSG